ncbi:MAG: V-type ATP synthase subunit D [Defluviitaleaceae bacterium]|nr:V-type ATP synthase subunit D [Defluviitaleaceae bacterium]
MDPSTFPTKGNLILAKNTLKLCRQGYDLLDKKRNVLMREISELSRKASELQGDIDRLFPEAYKALQQANIEIGISNVERLSFGVPPETTVRVRARSVMGVEIPGCDYDNSTGGVPVFGFGQTTAALDDAFDCFNRVKDLVVQLAAIENAAYRLAAAIKKTQKRANALKNVIIPRYENLVKEIQETLDEREREEFARLKVIKGRR